MAAATFAEFSGQWSRNAQLAWDTIAMREVRGIPTWMLNDMQWSHLEAISGNPEGSYQKFPVRVYRDFHLAIGCCFVDQWIPENPLTMCEVGYGERTARTVTTGLDVGELDGVRIDSPEAVVDHMERFLIPQFKARARHLAATAGARVRELIAGEVEVQRLLGPNMLKGPYSGFFEFPRLKYTLYGYANYFMAYSLYPEVLERAFGAEADMALEANRIAARAIIEGGLPRLVRLDHDMADSRGTLVDIRSLDRLWFPHFERSIRPLLDAGVRLIWHCDGNLMQMVPRLLEVGIGGFQGFQYEDGMDYPRICRMKTRGGDGLLIIGGVSVTHTLPYGSPADVREQIDWLVENGPRSGLMLGASSSIAPGVPLENIRALVEGLRWYRENGRTSD